MVDAVMDDPPEHVNFEFLISNRERETILKNIHPLAFSIFYGFVTKDLDTLF